MAKKFLTPITPPALATDPATGTTGAIYYNTVSNALKYYNGTTWTTVGSGSGGGSGESTSIEVRNEAPNSPAQGRVYFNSQENTIKIYNGNIWYDVAGPKELLDHKHYAGEGFVKYAVYGGYVDNSDLVFMDGGTSSSSFSDTIDGGSSL